MAVVVLLLWAVTAGAGLRLLFTSGIGGRRPAQPDAAQVDAAQPGDPASAMATAAAPASAADSAYVPAGAAPAPASAAPASAAPASPAPPAAKPLSERAARRARYDTPTLTRNKNEPIPGLGPLLEFTHPMFAITGLAFWLGYSLVHNRALAWIAFGLAVATICAGLSWFTANARAARRDREAGTAAGPSFSTRLVAIHGAAAALTFALAALTALSARG